MKTAFRAGLTCVVLAIFSSSVPLAAESPSAWKMPEIPSDNPLFRPSTEFLESPTPLPDSDAESEREMKIYIETIPGSEISFKMVPIPGGKFLMGSPETEKGRRVDEGPRREVEIKPFWMEEHETTWKEFELFAFRILRDRRSKSEIISERERLADAMAVPSGVPYDLGALSYDNAGKAGYPASGMTLYYAQLYCKWLTIRTGRYYRLPTEAEWEYACRAGSTTTYSFGETDEKLDEFAWYFGNDEGSSRKVKGKKPNAWGLYDMHGNLSEWVLEQYSPETYSKRKPENFGAPVERPRVLGFGQVVRGGNCEDDDPSELRSAARRSSVAEWKRGDPQSPQSAAWLTDAPYVGFRVVRPLEPPRNREEAERYDPDPEVYRTLRQSDP